MGLVAQVFTNEETQLMQEVEELMQEHHVSYDEIQEKIHQRIHKMLVIQLDPHNYFLTQNEVVVLKSELEGFITQRNYIDVLLHKIYNLSKERIGMTVSILSAINSFNFDTKDSISFRPKSDLNIYAENDHELRKMWDHRIKYNTLSRYYKDSVFLKKESLSNSLFLSEKAIEDRDGFICYFQNLENEGRLKEYVLNALVNAFCQSFDPHTRYLTPSDARSFESSLSSYAYGTGLFFTESAGRFFVSHKNEYGQAADYQEINPGDEITNISFNGKMRNLSCMDSKDLSELFYGAKTEVLKLELRSSRDSNLRTFILKKDTLYDEENHIFQFVLESESIKVGYLLFPKFYTKFNGIGRSSADDMARSLLRLGRLRLDGIIVDLRDNGGGSLVEASDFLSYFTDYGPLFTIIDKQNPEGFLVKDMKKGKVISGKILFLVNEFSASAAELVAATMQLYPNSLIVGSQTFGKATGQIMLPIDMTKQKGLVKITNLKVQQFNGNSYQAKGLIPDIVFPSVFDRTFVGESTSLHVLPNESAARNYDPIFVRNEPIEELDSLFTLRNSFSSLSDLSTVMKSLSELRISLNYKHFNDPFSFLENQELTDKTSPFQIVPFETNDAYESAIQKLAQKKSHDPILHEAFLIFEDWMELLELN